MSLNILMLAWEYPPDHVGGLGRHVCHLAKHLVKQGANVTVITRGGDRKDSVWRDDGVVVVPFHPYHLNPPDFITWAAQFNVGLLETVIKKYSRHKFDLIHAHDWVVAYASRALKHSWDIPLVCTIHATECGRQRGLFTPMQRHISETEWWLCYEAWRVVVCSQYMKNEVKSLFNVPEDKLDVIPNGISGDWFRVACEPDPDPLISYVGRLVPEKGGMTLIEAMPYVIRRHPAARLVIAGRGPYEDNLRKRVFELGLGQVVRFAGHLGDKSLKDLYSCSWVAVFPSSYEPFGIVALEAMATGVPCIVGNVGGFGEIIDHGRTGLKVEPGNPSGLAGAINELLNDPGKRSYISENSRKAALSNYAWSDIAEKTMAVYFDLVSGRTGKPLFFPKLLDVARSGVFKGDNEPAAGAGSRSH